MLILQTLFMPFQALFIDAICGKYLVMTSFPRLLYITFRANGFCSTGDRLNKSTLYTVEAEATYIK